MQRQLEIKSVVLDWMDKTIEITDTAGGKTILPWETVITVRMTGYPATEEKTMQARELDPYMMQGYVIRQIAYEEVKKE